MGVSTETLPLEYRASQFDSLYDELSCLKPLELLRATLETGTDFHLRVCRVVARAQVRAAYDLGDSEAARSYNAIADDFSTALDSRRL